MKYAVILLLCAIAPCTSYSEALFIDDGAKVSELSDIRGLAYSVMDAEGENCSEIKDRDLRSVCKCKYREEPLIKFRHGYKSIRDNNPQYIGKTVAYTKENKTYSLNFLGYELISKWCL
ncbi:hypothetical protein GCM10007916_23330 [Psychromonas marina]|uniref:DUF2147 domain-containing protein n=1 Tax=Psychromonas marina TaxID=88364 RepID=A0ABQ6E1F9_9GAMM|nr:hypothetical protein [Psychromonas marina]GLS91264.1 hypothetical protein GCM10007916_23330 [Psychromonas marina]